LGCFTNTSWSEVEHIIKKRIKDNERYEIPFVYDGEPGLDTFLADMTQSQRCTWHGPRGLYHALWEDGLKKKESQADTDRVKQLIGIELPQEDFQIFKEQDKEPVRAKYESRNISNKHFQQIEGDLMPDIGPRGNSLQFSLPFSPSF
jgi:hypothetical protein